MDKKPITLLICALGGEGGGVLVEWLVRTATASGYAVQSTSIPGVAQRTGATTYYIEVFPVPIAELGGKRPVFSLNPVPGALDALVSSELLETVRQIGVGMVSPDRTHVLTSTSRTLTTIEKMQLSDGRVSTSDLLRTAKKYSVSCHAFDMNAIARESGTVVSAVMMGAIAGSGLLPFPREAFESTVRQSERGVEASLRGFARAFDAIRSDSPVNIYLLERKPVEPSMVEPSLVEANLAESDPDESTTGTLVQLPAHVRSEFPASVAEIVALGYARLIDYQDVRYADLYLSRLQRILRAERVADGDGAHEYALTQEVARYLALWMAFDDIVRVADLKCRQSRAGAARSER